MTDLNALPELTTVDNADQLLIRDKSDTIDGVNGTDKFISRSNLVAGLGGGNPLQMKGNEVKLVYFTVAVSGVAADGWYFPDETVATLTGRTASITWEGTSTQIPAQGTTDASFKVGDTALVRSSTL